MLAIRYHETSLTFLLRQSKRALLGCACLLFAAWFDYRHYRRGWWQIFVVGVGLLIATLVVGHVAKGAKRWVLGFQPVEVARIATYVAVATILASQRPPDIRSFTRGLAPILCVTGAVAALLILQPNLGSTLALLGVVTLLLIVAGARFAHLGLLSCVGLAGVLGVIMVKPYMQARVMTFLNPMADLQGHGWQLHNSLIALGSGGVLGRGFGASLQKFFYLPDPHTDFILAIVGEERGLLGVIVILSLVAMIVWRGVRIAQRAGDPFGFYLALALTFSFAIYAGLNTAVVTGMVPTTGLPFPFVSYGGSALIMNMFAVGVLLNISFHGRPRMLRAPRLGAAGARAA
jgi:cell division protein FtsW